ncbi:MAG: YIP1 family protein [Actinobacteria bacterium]|nr:YIP1 family protein [Actinomycetota bacterium]MCA1738741.1 YIP1 family protein [Actinomycetota bacterium]
MRTLSRVAEEQRVLLAFVVTALYAALALVGSALTVFSGSLQEQLEVGGVRSLPPGFEDLLVYFEVSLLVWVVVSPFVQWLVVSGLMQLITRFFGGSGPFSGMLAAVGVAQVPFLVSAIISLPIVGLQIVLGPPDSASENPVSSLLGLLSSLLGLAFFIWFAVLVVIGTALARRVSYGQSTGSCAISCAGLIGLLLVVTVVVVVLIVAIIVVANPSGPS